MIAGSAVRIVLLTSGTRVGEAYTAAVLLGLSRRGVVPNGVISTRNVGLERDRGQSRPTDVAGPRTKLNRQVREVGPLNGEEMLSELRNLRPDYLALTGVGILSDEALSIPRCGTINAHPGLLPWVRGVAAVENSLLHGVAPGVTAHYVDAGVDTGDIISRTLIPVRSSDTRRSLVRRAEEIQVRSLVDVLAAALGSVPRGVPQRRRYPLGRRAPEEAYAELDEAIAGGLALRLHREWEVFFGGPVLPAADGRSPVVHVQPVASGRRTRET